MVQPASIPQQVVSQPSFPDLQAEIDRISNAAPLFITKRDEELHAWLNDQRDSKTSGIILAPQRSGVSESCQYYRLQYVRYKGSVLLLPASIAYLRIPSDCTQYQLFVELLNALHRNLKMGRLSDLRKRSRATLKEYGVKLIIVDDAHYLKLKALRELVQIHELLKIPVILLGTKDLYEQLRSDWKQVHNSFLAFYQFPAMTYEQTGSVVDQWLTQFLQWQEESDLLYEDVLKQLHEKTSGLTGPLYDTLQKIAVRALKKGLFKLDEETTLEVLNQQLKANVGSDNG
ncbi:MAG TPA: ATP-binding protein [Trichocoleus sp.]|jgi:hypothetical protein